MGKIPTTEEALTLLNEYNKEPFHLHHAQVVSGVLAFFAKELDPENVHFWAMVGLLHDIDFERYPDAHCIKAQEILSEHGMDEKLIHAILSHGYGHCTDVAPERFMEKILFAVDELTGLIGAAALMRPGGSVVDMQTSSVKKKFKDKKFAAGCSRDVILQGAQMLGWTCDELMERTLSAMQSLVGVLPV